MNFGYVIKRNDNDFVINVDPATYEGGYNVVPKSIDPHGKYDIEDVKRYVEKHPEKLVDKSIWGNVQSDAPDEELRESKMNEMEKRIEKLEKKIIKDKEIEDKEKRIEELTENIFDLYESDVPADKKKVSTMIKLRKSLKEEVRIKKRDDGVNNPVNHH